MPTESDSTGTKRVTLPMGGVANLSAFRDQPERFMPPETTRNVRPYDVAKDRPRIGMCPGIAKVFAQQFGNGSFIQCVDTVSRASVVGGYHLGATSPIFGRSVADAGIAGQIYGFLPGTTKPGLEWQSLIDVTGEGGPNPLSMACIARHPQTEMVVVGTTQYNDGSNPHKVFRVAAFDRYGAQIWSTKIADATKDRFCTTLAVSRLYTFVASNEFVLALRNDTGALAASTNCNQWSDQVVQIAVWQNPATGSEYVMAAFNGKTTAVVLPSTQAVTAGFYAKNFRAGVMKFLVPSDSYATTPVFTQAQWGRQLASTDTFYEAAHGYFRVSENSFYKPRGCLITAMAVDPVGNVYLTRTNAGGGPTATWPPSLAAVRPISVCKISSGGNMLWETDTDSIVRVGFGGFYNDVSTGAGIEPSLQAIAVDPVGGFVYVGGAQNAATTCAFKLDGGTGAVLWGSIIEGGGGPPDPTIRLAAIAVDPTDASPIFGGDSTTAYGTGPPPAANLFKLSPVSGAVAWAFELGAVSVLGLTVFPDGRLVIVSDQI